MNLNKVIFLSLFSLASMVVGAQTPDSWTRVTDFGGLRRDNAIAFSIDSFGYAGLGVSIPDTAPHQFLYPTDFWQFSPYSHSWVQKANFPGNGRAGAVCFTIGSKGYVGLGSGPSDLNDFWEYNPATDTWTQLGNFGGGNRTVAIGFGIDSLGYMGLGISDTAQTEPFKRDFWQYNPASDSWMQLGDFAGGDRSNATGFSLAGSGYVGFGNGPPNPVYCYNDFWKYDPATDTWTQQSDFIGKARVGPFIFCIESKCYMGGGIDSAAISLKEFWEYNPSSDTWIQKDSFGGGKRFSATGFSIGSYGYAGTGDTANGGFLSRDFWKYTPDSVFTGIQSISASNISISPNPTIEKLFINSPLPDFSISISDMTGQSWPAALAGKEMDVSALPAGVYCLRLQNADGIVVKKFVKE